MQNFTPLKSKTQPYKMSMSVFNNKYIFTFGYFIFKILALAPFNIKQNRIDIKTNNELPSLYYSSIGLSYNILLVILLFGSSFIFIPKVFTLDFPNKSDLMIEIMCAKAISGTCVLSTVWIIKGLRQRHVASVVDEIITADVTMNKLYHHINSNAIITSMKVNKWMIRIFFTINWIIWINLLTLDLILFPNTVVVTIIHITVPSFVCSWLLLQFAFVLTELEIRFRGLDTALKNFSINSGYLLFNNEKNSLMTSAQTQKIIMKDLFAVKRVHELLFHATTNIINYYAFSVLIVIILICGNIINSAYYLVQLLIDPPSDGSALIVLNSVTYLTMEIFPIVVMSFSVTRLTYQVGMIPNTIYQVMDYPTNCHELESHFEKFLVQLLHRDIPATAYNLIPLNGQLLHYIVGMVTTALVILIDISPKNKNEKN